MRRPDTCRQECLPDTSHSLGHILVPHITIKRRLILHIVRNWSKIDLTKHMYNLSPSLLYVHGQGGP